MIYNLTQLFENQIRLRPSKTAVIDGSRSISYHELQILSNQYSILFTNSGIKRGDRIAIYLRRSVESVAALFAAWHIGAIAVLVNDVLKNKQVQYIVDHAEAALLVTEKQLLNQLAQPVISIEKTIVLDEVSLSIDILPPSTVIDSDLALIIYTSGSTGMPKGIMLSHRNLISGAEIISDYLRITQNDIIISLLPFSFDYGLNQLLSSVLHGGTLVIERSSMPSDICNTLVRENITGLGAVPMLWQQLAHPRSPFTKISLPHLRYMTNTGGRMPEELSHVFRKAHPHVHIYLMFGLTEAFRSTYLPPDQVDVRPTSIGKAIPNVEILVINDKGEECAPDEVGELVHRGATISMGYWHDPENTAKRFRPALFEKGKNGMPEIAVYSGDYVKKDNEGFLYYIGRMDQMIKSRGMRVSPEEIEEYIYSSSLVSHAVAFSLPKNEIDTQIVAAIVPKDITAFKENDLRLYCKREMPEYMIPEIIWHCEQFPLTSTGKPDRIGIRENYLNNVVSKKNG
ncbi:MAG: AMP-binding protein [Bacteroidota bacterium]|nr:AMP-binding protein [Bacteroidota bacterium]